MSPEPKQPPKMLLTAARPPGMYDKQYHASAHDWTTRKTIVSPEAYAANNTPPPKSLSASAKEGQRSVSRRRRGEELGKQQRRSERTMKTEVRRWRRAASL